MHESLRRARFESLLDEMSSAIQGLRIAYKDDPPHTMPRAHRLLHALGERFVPEYRTRFTTVLGRHIYFPSGCRERVEARDMRWYLTLRHEYIHLLDLERHPLWMPLSYALAPPFGVLVPSMRAWWELRGYSQTMVARKELGLLLDDAMLEGMVELFAGRSYLFMLWPRSSARWLLRQIRAQVERGEIAGVHGAASLGRDVLRPIARRVRSLISGGGGA